MKQCNHPCDSDSTPLTGAPREGKALAEYIQLLGWEGRREKVCGRYANAYMLGRKLGSRAFQWCMTTLRCSIYACHIPVESS